MAPRRRNYRGERTGHLHETIVGITLANTTAQISMSLGRCQIANSLTADHASGACPKSRLCTNWCGMHSSRFSNCSSTDQFAYLFAEGGAKDHACGAEDDSGGYSQEDERSGSTGYETNLRAGGYGQRHKRFRP